MSSHCHYRVAGAIRNVDFVTVGCSYGCNKELLNNGCNGSLCLMMMRVIVMNSFGAMFKKMLSRAAIFGPVHVKCTALLPNSNKSS